RGARQPPRADARVVRPAVDRDSHLARGRDPEQVRAGEREGQRVGAGRVLEEELERAAVPARAEDDRLPVRRETRRADRAAAERDLLIGRWRSPGEALLEQRSGRARREERRRGNHPPRSAPPEGRTGRALATRKLTGHGNGRVGKVLPDALQVAGEIARRGVTLLRVLLQAPFDEPAEGSGDACVQPLYGLGLLADDRGERFRARPALERAFAGRHLVEDRSERELVRPEVDGPAAGLLR